MTEKILFVTLSNIGDAILTLPVLDALRARFPEADITVVSGPRPKEIFEGNPDIEGLIIYDKHARLKEKLKLISRLRKEEFSAVVDLRNSLFGFLLPARYKSSPFLIIPRRIKHMSQRHLCRLPRAILAEAESIEAQADKSIWISKEDENYINNLLDESRISKNDKIFVISAGARSHTKRWAKENFARVIKALIKEYKARVILVGDKEDQAINEYLKENSSDPLLDLSAKTTLPQLAYLLKKAEVVITNDSAVLHLASYLNRPVVAIFGPTNEEKYGPWSKTSALVKKEIFCRPCEKAQCRFGTLECLARVKAEDVLRQVRNILAVGRQLSAVSKYKRILIVRTDRIGDVLLSTPVIKALRENYPHAFIAMMVSPYAKDIVEGNPYLDEVIVYDKDRKHKSWRRSLKFASRLKKKKFDLALVLHPTNRAHLITFLAGIKKRVGLGRKLGFLLTDKIPHTKQLGEKQETEYALDLVRYLGITPKDKELFMPIRQESEAQVEELFRQEGIDKEDKLLAIHPGASCPSKIWPEERFAQTAQNLAQKYGFKILVVAGPKDMKLARELIAHMKVPAINLAGRTSVSQLASVLKRCALFISNDSGPVHIACAVGTPVISIFGRNQKGLSPKRWGPQGKKDKVLHKEVGCIECLAHNCQKQFACLKAITVADVVSAADEILKS
ncbi:MAG: lipopolysaccharide heptosyltransferase II [Candidatus Omnitrophica bacterium]|nr:lipopolysaccharide heptosyltransferase II [Candidatus Omnitrophota bacterium]